MLAELYVSKYQRILPHVLFTGKPPGSPIRRFVSTIGCGVIVVQLLLVVMLLVSCVGWLTGGWHYLDGYREGRIQKLSHKGFIWTTAEGELALPGFRTRSDRDDMDISNTWAFSVLDDEVMKQLQQLHEDELVRLHYHQYLCSPSWYGDSGYRVYKVEKVHKE